MDKGRDGHFARQPRNSCLRCLLRNQVELLPERWAERRPPAGGQLLLGLPQTREPEWSCLCRYNSPNTAAERASARSSQRNSCCKWCQSSHEQPNAFTWDTLSLGVPVSRGPSKCVLQAPSFFHSDDSKAISQPGSPCTSPWLGPTALGSPCRPQ